MAAIIEKSGETLALNAAEKRQMLKTALERIGRELKRVLILPPDFTRFNSNAGELTAILYDLLAPGAEVDIMPTLGTHLP